MIFDFIDNKVSILPEAMNLPEVRALYRSDKTKQKTYFDRYVKYIFYVYRENGIYRNQFASTRRRLTCVQQLGLGEKDWEAIERNPFVKNLVRWYIENAVTKEERLLIALDEDIDSYLQYLSGIKYTKRQRETSMNGDKEEITFRDVDNSDEKMKAIKNSKDLVIYRKELKKLVKETGKKSASKKTFRTRKFEE